MTETEVLMAGFGGQGMLLAGKLLAQAAMDHGLEVSWLPSYGPEMRGGTANVIVCLGEAPIGSPLIARPRALLVMNRPSLEKFGPKVRPGGLIVVNTTLIDVPAERDDCTVLEVDSRARAGAAGAPRAGNLVMLGAYVGASGVVPPETVEAALAKEFTGGRETLLAPNVSAFRAGLELGSGTEVTR